MNILVQPVFLKKDIIRKMDSSRKVWLCNWHQLNYAYIDIRTGLVYPCGLAFDTELIIGNVNEKKLDDISDAHLHRVKAKKCNCATYPLCKSGPLCQSYQVSKNECSQSEWMPVCPFPAIPINRNLQTTV